MARRLRMRPAPVKRAPEPVVTFTRHPGKGWSLPQAADLIRQGYTPTQSSRITGYFAQQIIGYYKDHGGLL